VLTDVDEKNINKQQQQLPKNMSILCQSDTWLTVCSRLSLSLDASAYKASSSDRSRPADIAHTQTFSHYVTSDTSLNWTYWWRFLR